MPIVVAGPYPTVEDIMQLARALVNDTYLVNGVSTGRILTDTASFTLPYLNSAIRKMRLELANNGMSTFIKDNVILTPVLNVQTVDPSVQTFISFSGYFDGTQMWQTPVLPPDLVVPIDMQERITGSGNPFIPMNQPQQGLVSRQQTGNLVEWEWRTDQINMIGSTNTEDLRLRYEAVTIQSVQPGSDFTITTLGSIDCQEALAYEVASMFATARGSVEAAGLRADALEAKNEMVTRYVRRQQEITYERAAFGNTGGQWYPGGNSSLP